MNPKPNSDGFAAIWVLSMCFLVLLLGSFFYQIGSVLVLREQLVAAADSAASSGATAIDEDELIESGNVVLNQTDAEARCQASLDRAKGPDGNARGILDTNGSVSTCEAVDGNTAIQVVARGRIETGPIMSMLQIPGIDLAVTSRSRPSCSDDTSVEGGC